MHMDPYSLDTRVAKAKATHVLNLDRFYMSLTAIAPYVFTEESVEGRMKTIQWLQTHNLLADRMICNRCHLDMILVKRERSGSQNDKWAWSCSECSSVKSIRSGSWFEGHCMNSY